MAALQFLFLAGLAPYQLAFAAYTAVLVGTAIPLGYAWARVLPEDAPAFKIEPGSFPAVDLEPVDPPATHRNADLLSLGLLLCVTLTYLLRFPGIPLGAFLHWIHSVIPAAAANSIIFGGKIILVVGTALAACLATVRPGPMRVPLVTAASLVLTLWLLGPILHAALLSG
jgi:hypothetical protein